MLEKNELARLSEEETLVRRPPNPSPSASASASVRQGCDFAAGLRAGLLSHCCAASRERVPPHPTRGRSDGDTGERPSRCRRSREIRAGGNCRSRSACCPESKRASRTVSLRERLAAIDILGRRRHCVVREHATLRARGKEVRGERREFLALTVRAVQLSKSSARSGSLVVKEHSMRGAGASNAGIP
jgi:hypothetical protein